MPQTNTGDKLRKSYGVGRDIPEPKWQGTGSIHKLPSSGMLDDLRNLIASNDTAYDLQQNIGKGLKLLNALGISDDPSSIGGPETAAINTLSKTKNLAPELKRALEYVTEKFPMISRAGKFHRFVQKLPVPGPNLARTGQYNPMTDTATIALTARGIPRSAKDIVRTTGHETVHTIQNARRTRKGKDIDTIFNEMSREQIIPYKDRPSEVEARKIGDALVKWLEKEGIL